MARSPAHRLTGDRASTDAGLPVTDIVAGTHIAETPAYLAALHHALKGAAAVILAEPYLLPAVVAVGGTVPRVYDAFNVESDLKAGALPQSAFGRHLLLQVEETERRAVIDSVAITACSDEDAAALAAAHTRPIGDFTVVPNGTDCRYEMPSEQTRRGRRDRWLRRWSAMRPGLHRARHLAVFFASWHPPNLDAAEILLWLAPQLPDVQFVLGGSHGAGFSDRTPPANLVFTGVIGERSKRALLAAADVALNPMLLGSGTNLKVIEYLAAGVPVVSTGFGVRGLAAVDGTHLVVAEPHEMVAAVRAVLADPEGAAARARAGRALALERYDWITLGEQMAAVVRRAAGLSAGPPVVCGQGGPIRG
ncbi:MAG: glycosyltransferase [Acidimicrobiales bacterium]